MPRVQREIAPTSSLAPHHAGTAAREAPRVQKPGHKAPPEAQEGVKDPAPPLSSEGPHVSFVAVLAIAASLVIGYHVVKKLTRLFFQILLVAAVLFGLGWVLTHFHLVTW